MAVRFTSNGYDLTCAERSDALAQRTREVVAFGYQSKGVDLMGEVLATMVRSGGRGHWI